MNARRLILLPLAALALIATGCHDLLFHPDLMAPDRPSGLRTSTGDNFIELFWNENYESDLAGYHVYVASSYSGRYELIATTRSAYFMDGGARNGNTYYYAVSAFDEEGNESELSSDVAYDIPRPEGYNLLLTDFRTAPRTAGYDFSAYAVVPFDATAADMYFDNDNGRQYMVVGDDSDIKDMGPTRSILEISEAPAGGWSSTHDVLLQVGHTYVVWTWDDHYAKFRVVTLSPSRVVVDWAYQLAPSNPLLKRAVPTERAAVVPHTRN